jgi:hypothetical protein
VRQRLADKISDNLCGLWLLVPEHLRLGTWDLLRAWTRKSAERIEPRLALQLVHEAALCTNGLREGRCLTHAGFETLNGLPFLATDVAVHCLLDDHSVSEAERLQVSLGKLRRASGHYAGELLLIDPHRAPSYSQRHMRKRCKQRGSAPIKMAQTFFCLDSAGQPLCFTTANSSRTVSQATPGLLQMAAAILEPLPKRLLVAADAEHFTAELFDHVRDKTPFDLIVPMPHRKRDQHRWQKMPAEAFTRHWAGYATAVQDYLPHCSQCGPYHELVQRQGERPEDWQFHSFLSTTDCDPVQQMTGDYPDRWHIEEFFNFNQCLSWRRAGTLNENIRYGQMTMALVAQTVIHQFRRRLGAPYDTWDAQHLASDIFRGLDGDIRVRDKTIVVTYYNAPNAQRLRDQYEELPKKLKAEGVDPTIPWLYDFQLDFQFK